MNDLSKRLTLFAGSALLALGASACGGDKGRSPGTECDSSTGAICPCTTTDDCAAGESCISGFCLPGGSEEDAGSGEDASDVGTEDATTDTGGGEDADTGGGEDADTSGGEDTDTGGSVDADSGGGEDADAGDEDADTGGGDDGGVDADTDVVDPPECEEPTNPWVFFISGDRLNAVRLDGTGLTEIDNGDLFYRNPSASHDGSMVVYNGGNAESLGMTLIDFEAGESRRLVSSTEPIPRRVTRGSFSSDDSTFVFAGREGSSDPNRIYLYNIEAGTAEIVSPESTLSYNSPVWGADDEWIYFSKEVSSGTYNLSRIRPDGTDEEALDFTPVFGSISISTELGIVGFGTEEGGGTQLYFYDIARDRADRFAERENSNPSFSRCGEDVVVSRRFGGGDGDFTFNLASLNPDTGAFITRLTENPVASFEPWVGEVESTDVDLTNTGTVE